MFAKNRHINLKFSMLYVQVQVYNKLYVFLFFFENFGFWRKLYNNLSFYFLGVKKKLFGKIRDSSLKELIILRHLVLFCLHFTFNPRPSSEFRQLPQCRGGATPLVFRN